MIACILCWDNQSCVAILPMIFLYVDGMVDDVVGGHINFGVGIVIDIVGELCELGMELLFPLSRGFGEEGFGEDKIGVGVTHGLKLLGNCLLSHCVSKTEGGLVGVQFIDTSFVGNKVNSFLENVK